MKKEVILFLFYSALIISLTSLIYADIEIPTEFCGDGVLQTYLGEQCDPGLIDFSLPEDSLFQLMHCKSPLDYFNGMECRCESTLSDNNGNCYFCGDGIYTPINPLNESCDGSEHCTFDCTCEFDYIGNEYGQCVKCWGDNLNGHTCQTEGFQYGTLLCNGNGNFDSS